MIDLVIVCFLLLFHAQHHSSAGSSRDFSHKGIPALQIAKPNAIAQAAIHLRGCLKSQMQKWGSQIHIHFVTAMNRDGTRYVVE